MKVAVLTRPDFKSPMILAESIKHQLIQEGIYVEIFYHVHLLNRMVPFSESKLSFHFWFKKKIVNLISDAVLLKKLKQFDVIIISECIPNGYLKKLYNVERFKKIIKKPVGIYEVYFLGNAPTQIQKLQESKAASLSRYNFHLSVSNITEIKTAQRNNWFSVGIKAETWKLKPFLKKEVFAIIDFAFPGNELIRQMQIDVLQKLEISYISLEREYTVEEIRKIYQKGSIYFLQSYEAFGLPILECLCSGCQIFTAESWWPMSWRLNESPQIHGNGILPECFTVYNGEADLETKLLEFKINYDCKETPKKIFANFLNHYPQYYYGNGKEVERFIKSIQKMI